MRGRPRLFLRACLAVVLAATGIGVGVAAGEPVAEATATAQPRPTTVQEPYPCPSIGVWNFYRTLLSDDAAPTYVVDDVAPSRTPTANNLGSRAYQTGPDLLDLTVPAAIGVTRNDSSFLSDNSISQNVVVLSRAPQHAKGFQLNADGSYTWVPRDGYTGGDSFEYTYRDINQLCWDYTGTVTIPPAGGNRSFPDSFTVTRDTTFTTPPICGVNGCGVLRNDIILAPPATTTLSAIPSLQPQNGTVSLTGDGRFTYTPDPGFVGTDSFYYYINTRLSMATATFAVQGEIVEKVSLDVVEPRPATVPVGGDDAFTTPEDTPVTMTAAELLANDTNGRFIFATNSSAPGQVQRTQHGSIRLDLCEFFEIANGSCTALNSIQSVTYTPDQDYNGPDFFGYFANAQLPATPDTTSDVVWVTFDVTSVRDEPTLVDDAVTVPAHVPTVIDVFANDRDPDDRLDRTTLLRQGSQPAGRLTLPGDGTFVVTPDGTETEAFLGYTARNVDGTTLPAATVVFTVTPNPSLDDAYRIDEDTVLTVPAPGVLANDKPAPGTVSGPVELVSGPANGTLALAADGSFSYTPTRDFAGDDEFVYRADDDTAVARITVDPVNDAPVVGLRSSCVSDENQTCFGDFDNRGNLLEGQTARLRGYVDDVERDPGTLVVNWGDGSTTTLAYPCTPEQEALGTCALSPTSPVRCDIGQNFPCTGPLFFDLRHVYANNPPAGTPSFMITATATEAERTPGGAQSGSATSTATVADVPPTLLLRGECTAGEGELCAGSFSVLSGTEGGDQVRVAGRVTDPGDATGSLVVDWGDGTTDTVQLGCVAGQVCPATPSHPASCAITTSAACGEFSLGHSYADDPADGGTYTVTVTATVDGAEVERTTAVTVADVAPTLVVDPPCADGATCERASVLEVLNGTDVVVVGSISDPGPDSGSLTVDWGDGSPDTVVPVDCGDGGEGCGPFRVSHGYAERGEFDVTVTATTDGASDTTTVRATVLNNAPVWATPDTLTYRVKDSPPALQATDADGDPLTYAVVDGTLPSNLTLREDGTFAQRGGTRPGSTTVTLAVSDGQAPPVTHVVTFQAVPR